MKIKKADLKKAEEFKNNKREFYIRYQTEYSTGILIVDTKYYTANIKRFDKLLKDAVILEFTERDKINESK